MERPRILLADDSVTIRKVVELTFADEGIDVICVGDGDAAMVSFVENEPDLVIADVNMPGVGGYTICDMIKQDESTRDIPVILLTGSFEPFDPGEASRVGANYYFTKPFQSIRELVAKVRDLLDTKAFDSAILAETEDIDGLYKDSFADTLEIEGNKTVPEIGYDGMEAEISAVQAAAIENEKEFPENLTVADLGYEGMDDEILEHQPDAKHETEPAADLSVADLGFVGMADEMPQFEVLEKGDALNERVAGADVNDPFYAPIDLGDAGLDDEMIETTRPGEESDSADDAAVMNSEEASTFEPTQTYADGPKIDPFETPITTDDTITKFNWTDEAVEVVNEPAAEQTFSESPATPLRIEFADTDEESTDKPAIEVSDEAEIAVGDLSLATKTVYSPELIELIAQRVIEHLSDKVIREVAMEVVPKITEDMIREALENESIK